MENHAKTERILEKFEQISKNTENSQKSVKTREKAHKIEKKKEISFWNVLNESPIILTKKKSDRKK